MLVSGTIQCSTKGSNSGQAFASEIRSCSAPMVPAHGAIEASSSTSLLNTRAEGRLSNPRAHRNAVDSKGDRLTCATMPHSASVAVAAFITLAERPFHLHTKLLLSIHTALLTST